MMAFKKLLSLAVSGCLLAGCGKEDKDGDDETREAKAKTSECISFSEKSGLTVSAEMAERIGLKTAEAHPREIKSALRFTANVNDAGAEVQTNARASAFLSAEDASKLQLNQQVDVTHGKASVLSGRIVSIAREPEVAANSVEVQIEFPLASTSIKRGETVEVHALGGSAQTQLSIPRAALLQSIEGWFVYVVNGGNFTRTAIKVGAMDDEFAAITDGLLEGDQVATHGSAALWLSELKFTKAGAACCPGESK